MFNAHITIADRRGDAHTIEPLSPCADLDVLIGYATPGQGGSLREVGFVLAVEIHDDVTGHVVATWTRADGWDRADDVAAHDKHGVPIRVGDLVHFVNDDGLDTYLAVSCTGNEQPWLSKGVETIEVVDEYREHRYHLPAAMVEQIGRAQDHPTPTLQRVRIIGGPWPERIGRSGVVCTSPKSGCYPQHVEGEVIVLLDDDPLAEQARSGRRLGGRARMRPWSCHIGQRDVVYL